MASSRCDGVGVMNLFAEISREPGLEMNEMI